MALKAANKTERAWNLAYNRYMATYENAIEKNAIFGSAGIIPYSKRQFRAMYAAVQGTKGFKAASDEEIIKRLIQEQRSLYLSYNQAQNTQRAMALRGIVVSIEELQSGMLPIAAQEFERDVQDRYRQLRAEGVSTKDCAIIIAREFYGSP